jgi:hypothetical protein
VTSRISPKEAGGSTFANDYESGMPATTNRRRTREQREKEKSPLEKALNSTENNAEIQHKHAVSKNSKKFKRLPHDQSTENQSDPPHPHW